MNNTKTISQRLIFIKRQLNPKTVDRLWKPAGREHYASVENDEKHETQKQKSAKILSHQLVAT